MNAYQRVRSNFSPPNPWWTYDIIVVQVLHCYWCCVDLWHSCGLEWVFNNTGTCGRTLHDLLLVILCTKFHLDCLEGVSAHIFLRPAAVGSAPGAADQDAGFNCYSLCFLSDSSAIDFSLIQPSHIQAPI